MKYLIYILILTTTFAFAQRDRKPIDSIHNKRLCTCYPGMTRFQSVKESFDESKYVFVGKVIEIVRTETMEPNDYGLNDQGEFVPLYFDPIYHYWYVLEVNKWYKGKTKTKNIKIYSRIFSNVSPLLILDKDYLIFAVKGEIQESPYIYCNGNSGLIESVPEYIKELEQMKK